MKWRNIWQHILLWVLLTACCYGSSTKSTTTPMSPSKNAIANHPTQSILFSTDKASPTIHVLDQAVQDNLSTENSVMAATTVATASKTTITAFGIEHNSPNSPSIVSQAPLHGASARLLSTATSTSSTTSVCSGVRLPIPCCQVHTDNTCLTCEKCYNGYDPSPDLMHCDVSPLIINGSNSFVAQDKASVSSSAQQVCTVYQYPSMLTCWDIGRNCLTYDSNGVCISCSPNLNLTNGRCFPLISAFIPCAETNKSQCLKCKDGATMIRPGYCQQTEPNCREYNTTTGQCIKCLSGYLIKSNFCLLLASMSFAYADSHCREWQAGKCIACETGWTIITVGSPCQQNASQPITTSGILIGQRTPTKNYTKPAKVNSTVVPKPLKTSLRTQS